MPKLNKTDNLTSLHRMLKYKKGCVSGVDNQECIANKTLYPELIKLILSDPDAIFPLTRGRVQLKR